MPARKTYEQVKTIFEDAKCRLHSKEYVNGSEPLEYYCHCGNEDIVTITLQNFTKHGIAKCPKCPGHRPFPKKLNYDDVKAIFADKGCVLLSKTYISSKKSLQYRCGCGNEEICEIDFQSFQIHGTNCGKCRDARMRATNQERFGVDYVNQREGEVKERAMAGIAKYVEEKKHKYDDVKANFESKGLKLLETDYASNVTPMRYECITCGNCSTITYGSLYNGGHSCNGKECVKKKMMATNMERYGHLFSSSSTIIKDKIKNTHETKYGMWYMQTNEFKERYRKTCMDKYGVDNYIKTDEFKETYIKTCMDKYGVENYSLTDEFKQKYMMTCMDRYSVENYSMINECKDKIKECHGMWYFQTDDFKKKCKKTCIERYGFESYSQTNEFKEKFKKTCINRYGVYPASKNNDIVTKMKNTNIERYGVPYTFLYHEFRMKTLNTLLNQYGVDNVSKVPDIQAKKMATSYLNHDCAYPMQNADIAQKSMNNSFKLKSYKLPSGKEIVLQGYENSAIDLLLKYYNEDDIFTGRKSVPEIWYTLDSGKYKRYFADILIKKNNIDIINDIIIEVKSTYTYALDIKKLNYKMKACKYQGYKFILLVFDKKGNLLNLDDLSYILS